MSFALRLLARDIRRGDVMTLLIALIISVSTVTAISLFIDRLSLSFQQTSSDLMGADRLISSDTTLPQDWLDKANELSLQHAERVSFRTMIFAHEKLQLSHVSAVTGSYPLRGEFLTEHTLFGPGSPSASPPQKGHIWLSSRLASSLSIGLGDSVEVGETTLTVSRFLVRDPGSSASAFAVAPRAVMNLADLAATKVIIPGSRVRYALLLAGDETALQQYQTWLSPQLQQGQRWRTPVERGEQVGDTIQKAHSFLLLAGALAVILSGIAMALASARFVKRHLMQLAVLKTMGATPQVLTRLFTIQFAVLFVIGVTIGLGAGWLLQGLISVMLSELLSTTLPPPSLARLWLGVATGFISMLAFCVPMLQRLINISPMSVLQPSIKLEQNTILISGIGFIGMYALMCIYTQGLLLPTILLAALFAITCVVALLGFALFRIGRRLTSGATSGWQIGFASLYRRLAANLFQLLIFTVIIMLGLILLGIQTSLIADWQKSLPADSANHYLFNVQADQIREINEQTHHLGIISSKWFPMVRGRVVAVNDVDVATRYPKETQQPELVQRAMNLTWSDSIGPGSQLIEGDFSANGISIEQQTAEKADIGIGDTLTLNIGGNEIRLPITSIRTVDWSSMQPNFYLILPKQALESYPANYVSSAYISQHNIQAFYQTMAQFPTVSILNIGDILQQVQTVIHHLSKAIQIVLLCILAAGGLVLIASVRSTIEERLTEGALLRVLGAKSSLVRQALFVEFCALGLFSGLIAAVGAEASLYGLQVFVFDATPSWHPLIWTLGPLVGLMIISSIGLLASRTVLQVPPMQLLRNS